MATATELKARRDKVRSVNQKRSRGKPRKLRPIPEPKAAELLYTKRATELIREVRRGIGSLSAAVADVAGLRIDARAPDDLKALIRRPLGSVFSRARILRIANEIADRTNAEHVRNFIAQVGVSLRGDKVFERVRAAFVSRNVDLLSSLQSQLRDQIDSRIDAAIARGARAETLAGEIAQRLDVSESRARLIARDQVGTFYGELNAARQQDLGVTRYVWSTARDERVRGRPDGLYPNSEFNHWEREGQIFEWSDPPEDGHPSIAINCRCVAIPVIE